MTEKGYQGIRRLKVRVRRPVCGRYRVGQWRMQLAAVIFAAVCTLVCAPPSAACTLWAAAGERVSGGGVLIAKNRDWTPEPDEVRLATFKGGLRFVGLFPVREGRRQNAVAGISETGLVFVGASAGSVPEAERNRGKPGLAVRALSEFASVADVVQNRDLFSQGRPAMYLFADRVRIAWIEVAPGGRVAVRTTDSGILCHTNHYLDQGLRASFPRIGRSSASRLERIRQLSEGGPPQLNLEDFFAFSRDTHAGPDNSIWRTGSREEKERTLATWIVSLPKDRSPSLFVRLANPGEPERATTITLDGPFWKRGDETVF